MTDVFKRHQNNIAKKTMTLSCVGARILGGMDHVVAARLLNVQQPSGCACGANADPCAETGHTLQTETDRNGESFAVCDRCGADYR